MPSAQEKSSMQRCSVQQEVKRKKQPSCCYGAPGCTAAPLSTEPSLSPESTSSGKEQRQENNSEQHCQQLSLSLSEDATLQDLYLLLRGLCDGGFAVSVTVQATPSKESALSRLDILERSGCWTGACLHTELQQCLAALWECLKSTTPSSKQRGSSEQEVYEELERWREEPRKGCLGKLQEGRQ